MDGHGLCRLDCLFARDAVVAIWVNGRAPDVAKLGTMPAGRQAGSDPNSE